MINEDYKLIKKSFNEMFLFGTGFFEVKDVIAFFKKNNINVIDSRNVELKKSISRMICENFGAWLSFDEEKRDLLYYTLKFLYLKGEIFDLYSWSSILLNTKDPLKKRFIFNLIENNFNNLKYTSSFFEFDNLLKIIAMASREKYEKTIDLFISGVEDKSLMSSCTTSISSTLKVKQVMIFCLINKTCGEKIDFKKMDSLNELDDINMPIWFSVLALIDHFNWINYSDSQYLMKINMDSRSKKIKDLEKVSIVILELLSNFPKLISRFFANPYINRSLLLNNEVGFLETLDKSEKHSIGITSPNSYKNREFVKKIHHMIRLGYELERLNSDSDNAFNL